MPVLKGLLWRCSKDHLAILPRQLCFHLPEDEWKSMEIHSIRIDFIYNPSTIHLPCYSIIPWYSMIFHDSFLSYPQSIVHLGDGKPKHWSMKLKTPEYMNVRQNSDIETTRWTQQFHLFNKISTQARPPVSQTAARPHKQLLPESPVWEQRYVKTSTSNCGVDI